MLGAIVPNGMVFIPGGPVTIAPGSMLRSEVRWHDISFKTPTQGMLDSFIQLWQQPDERIRRFAERWGPLAIQSDGTHLDIGKWERIDREASYGLDSLPDWKYFSRRAYSVLKIAANLQQIGRASCRERV